MKEEWKEITKGRTIYLVSNMGKVIKRKNINGVLEETEVKPKVNDDGQLYIGVYSGGRSRRRLARLVAELFIPNPNDYQYINFIDNNRENCRADNIEWVDFKTIYNKVEYTKVCPVCGKEFVTNRAAVKICSAPCKDKAIKEKAQKKKEETKRRKANKYSPERAKNHWKEVAEIQKKARELGMDYGNYVARYMR